MMIGILKDCLCSKYLRVVFIVILSALVSIGCGGGDDPAPATDDNGEIINLSGTWDLYDENNLKTNTFILVQTDDVITVYQEYGTKEISFQINEKELTGYDHEASSMTGTINVDNTKINGVTCDEGSCDTWTLQKTSNSIDFKKLSGTWDLYDENNLKTNTFILVQTDDVITVYQEDGTKEFSFQISEKELTGYDHGASSITGTINVDNTKINGVTCDEGPCDTWTLQKTSNSIDFI